MNAYCKGINSTCGHHRLYLMKGPFELSMLLVGQAQSHAGTQDSTRRHNVEGLPSGEEEALRHQLDCYRTAAKQLSVLLMHRNKEIEGSSRDFAV